MTSNAPVQNIKSYVAGIHRFLNVGTGSDAVPVGTLVALEKREVMRIVSCNIGIGTTLPRGALDVVGSTYVSQNIGIGTTIVDGYSLSIIGDVYSSGDMVSSGFIGSLYGIANAAIVASNALELSGTPDITVGAITANGFVGPLYGVANAATVASNALGLTGTPDITVGTISCTTISGGSGTLSGTLVTSNLTVLGSNMVVNTYTQQSSNFSVCNITGTGPALSAYQKGVGASYPIVDFYDIDISTTVPLLRVADGGNVGIGTASPIAPLHVQGNVYTSANIGIGTTITRDQLDVIGDAAISGNIGIGTTMPIASLHISEGTTTLAPILITTGSNLSSATAGAIEYDNIKFYGTGDTTSGRGYFPNYQIFRLTADRGTIGPAIASFFGANTAINIAAGGVYDLEATCHFVKRTIGTITVTLTTSSAVANLNGHIMYNNSTVTGARAIHLINSATTGNAFTVSAAIGDTASNSFHIRGFLQANATNNSTLTINFTESGGTVVPLRGSYYRVTRLPAGNTGTFS